MKKRNKIHYKRPVNPVMVFPNRLTKEHILQMLIDKLLIVACSFGTVITLIFLLTL